jgi:hypothetical protein
MLIHAFSSVDNGDPSQKAKRLARAISEAMNRFAFEVLVVVATLIVLRIFRARLPRRPDDDA